MDGQFALLVDRRLGPLFIAQILGAFNDYLMKTIVSVMLAYGLWETLGLRPEMVVSIAAALFILPFVLFCPLAGVICDRMDKAVFIRRVKIAEMVIAALGVVALMSGSLIFALIVVFGLGAQSALFAPAKFSILPQHLTRNELVAGNGLMSTGTYLAILAGTIAGSLLALMQGGAMIAGGILIVFALAGYAASLRIPEAVAEYSDVPFSFNPYMQVRAVLRYAFIQKRRVVIAILGTAWFYFVAAVFHAQFPNLTKQVLGVDQVVLSGFMVMFSVGIAIGGLFNHALLRGRAMGHFAALACIGMAVFGIDLYVAAIHYPKPDEGLDDLAVFLSHVAGWRLYGDTFMQTVCAGLFVVPLRAIVQAGVNGEIRARVVSASSMVEALFILLSAVMAGVLFSAGVKVEALYLWVSLATLAAGLTLAALPDLKEAEKESV